MKLAGVVILFNPTEEIYYNVNTYINILEWLYVIDNTENNTSLYNERISSIYKVSYLHDGKNRGIAERLNQVAKMAIEKGYDMLLTMDQDSSFDVDQSESYKKCLTKNSLENIAMFGVEYQKKKPNGNICNCESTVEIITSGSVLNLSAWQILQGFDEALFIDFVDHEFCYRAIIREFKILKFTNIFIKHSVGKEFKARSISSFKNTQRSLHSSLRIYYMVRNYFYLKKKYSTSYGPLLLRQRNSILTRIKNNFLYGHERINLCKYIYKAYKDYKQMKMGKFN